MTNTQKQILTTEANKVLSIRVQEISAELNLQHTYPNRNIFSFQETETINSQEGVNLSKKTNELDGRVKLFME